MKWNMQRSRKKYLIIKVMWYGWKIMFQRFPYTFSCTQTKESFYLLWFLSIARLFTTWICNLIFISWSFFLSLMYHSIHEGFIFLYVLVTPLAQSILLILSQNMTVNTPTLKRKSWSKLVTSGHRAKLVTVSQVTNFQLYLTNFWYSTLTNQPKQPTSNNILSTICNQLRLTFCYECRNPASTHRGTDVVFIWDGCVQIGSFHDLSITTVGKRNYFTRKVTYFMTFIEMYSYRQEAREVIPLTHSKGFKSIYTPCPQCACWSFLGLTYVMLGITWTFPHKFLCHFNITVTPKYHISSTTGACRAMTHV